MQIEFLGAAHEVTGSCHYVTFGDKHVLVDCGMEQGPDLYVSQEIPVNAAAVDYVFVTHAHIDHSGLLPLLYNHGFRGQIFATEATTQTFEQNNHVVINNDGTNGQIGPAALKAVYDMARKGARDEIQAQMRDGGLFSGGGR